MKKIFLFGGIAAMALSVASCSSELDQPGSADGNVHFRVQLPAQMRTRAFADGKTASTLTYAVYESGTKNLVTQGVDAYTFDPETLTADVTLQLVNGKKYDIVFWADAPGQNFYKFEPSTQEVTVSYTSLSGNDETRDAFFKCQTFDVTGPINETVELRRPFAQVNLGTDDLQTDAVKQAYADGLKVALSTTAYSTLNLVNGQVGKPTAVSFAAAPAADCTSQPFPYNPIAGAATPNPYEYIAMDYILVDAAKDVIDLTYTFYNGTAANQQPLTVSNVPVQRNYRTNIYGSVLTSPANLKVEIIPDFAGDDYNTEIAQVTTADQAAAAIQAGGNVSVSAPLELLDLSASTPAKPLVLTLNAPVKQIKLGTAEADPQPTTIYVAKDVAYPQFLFPGSKSQTPHIRNLTIKGDLSSSERCHGFDAQGSASNPGVQTIDGLTFDNVPFTEYGINVAFTANPQTTRNITVTNCDFADLKKSAFSLQTNGYTGDNVGNIVIENNTIQYAADAVSNTNGIYILSTTGGTVTIKNNTVNGAPYHGMMLGNNKADMTVQDNTVTACKQDGIKMDQPYGNIGINGNTIQAAHYGIRIARFVADYNPVLTISGNKIDQSGAAKFYYGIYVGYSSASGSHATLDIFGNIKAGGEPNNWFNLVTVTPDEGSNYATPFAD